MLGIQVGLRCHGKASRQYKRFTDVIQSYFVSKQNGGLTKCTITWPHGQDATCFMETSIIPDILDPVLQPDPTFSILYTLLILPINNV
jgi:hypothetical protein